MCGVHRNAEFSELEAILTARQLAMYDEAVAVWQQLRSKLELALDLAAITSKDLWKSFWAAQQRFFKLLCVSLKVPTVVEEVSKRCV